MPNALTMVAFETIKSRLSARISDESITGERQSKRRHFAPDLAYGRHFAPPIPSSKPAAVLILIEPREGQWTIPLTVRPQHLPDHPGQISFPGGRLEPGETALEAAHREFEEELGKPFAGAILGELSPLFVFNSNYAVRPFVAISSTTADYEPCPNEVARIVHLPVSTLLAEKHHPVAEFERGSVRWNSRTISHQGDQIWGATAVMLGELAAIVKNVL